MKFGEHAKMIRESASMTMVELSQISGVNYETIKSFEHDRRGTSLQTAVALADALGVSLDEYIGRKI